MRRKRKEPMENDNPKELLEKKKKPDADTVFFYF
jgi:hypothetical protein